MDIEFREHDGITIAQNPRIERLGNQRIIKLNEKNCDYFLVLAKTPGGYVDLRDPSIQQGVLGLKDLFPNVMDIRIADGVTVSCVDEVDYKINDYGGDSICIPNKIAEFTVVGCREENGVFVVCIPEDGISCTARVSLTVTYRITQVSGETAHRPFGNDLTRQTFFSVEFDDIPNYQDGGIVFRFEDNEMEYPITSEMIEHGRVFIEAGCGRPIFSSRIAGLELQQA